MFHVKHILDLKYNIKYFCVIYSKFKMFTLKIIYTKKRTLDVFVIHLATKNSTPNYFTVCLITKNPALNCRVLVYTSFQSLINKM